MSNPVLASSGKARVDAPVESIGHALTDRSPGNGLTAEQRKLRSSIAAHESWARTTDRAGRTANARAARQAKYLERAREIHAGHHVSEEFIAEVAEHLRVADLKRMALASARVRSAKASKKAG